MTAAVRITDAEIKRQAAGTERDLRDVENRGLYLRFMRNRSRASWYLVKRGQWNLIGSFPDLSAKQVVAALPAIRLRLDAGAGSNLSKWVTTGELLDWYADRMSRDRSLSEKRKKTGASLIKCHLKPRLGALPLTGIDKASLDDQFMWPAQETIGIDYVRSAFQLLALAFRQAFKLRLIAANPMKDIKFSDFSKAKVGIKPSRLRGTQLQDLIARLLTVLDTDPADGLLALMMLCHGTRIGETRQARWAHISLAEREWFIPAENTKTGVEHHLPLTEQVRRILIGYRDIQWASGYSGQFLFPSRSGKALSEGQASAVFARLGQGEWTSHDLRKVARTGWADIGIDHLIGELLINHAMGHNVKVYIQSDVMSRKRDALEKWHAHLDSKGLNQIQALTGFRSGDFGNGVQVAEYTGCDPIHESTIGEV
ncbi:tyrosine-type recombinase/integrase [Pseudomonas viridiflava]|uniref:tyrosine-type recombinase/integrase n=1 Tax=Pseudomonas viridiflava TaxID=33069 RepID=UPI00201C4C0E|nr:site-specific integrase [Pseudomonas viridiflava]